jgi:hypothetical protein
VVCAHDIPTPLYTAPASPLVDSCDATPPTPVLPVEPEDAPLFDERAFFNGLVRLGRKLISLRDDIIDANHPPICIWGYGNLGAYSESSLRIITCGVNGSAADAAFAAPDQVSQLSYERCVRHFGYLQDAEIDHFKGRACTYFEQPQIAPYFRNFR